MRQSRTLRSAVDDVTAIAHRRLPYANSICGHKTELL